MERIDLLDEDEPIPQQKFVCISFISPEKIIKKKEDFYLEKFLENYQLNKSLQKFNEFINYISVSYNIDINELNKEYEEFVESQKNTFTNDFKDDYKTFMDKNEEQLLYEFNKQNNFETSVRGVKIRGVFPTEEEAQEHVKKIRGFDTNHDVYVGNVGLWLPFDPDAYKTGKVEYLEDQLNNLMKEKHLNEQKVKEEFEKRKKEDKLKAIQENIEKSKETGNKLTQSINDKGELVKIDNIKETDKVLGVNTTLQDIEKEIFK